MEDENFTYVWSSYDKHLKETLQEMHKMSKYYDVMLVCDDLVNISSHKAILSSYSKMFRDIFDFGNIDSNVVLFLHGVQSDMLKSIMQYIYVGEIQLKNDTKLKSVKNI